MSVVLADDTLPLLGLDLSNHAISDPFVPPQYDGPIEPEFWMPIPKLPGEEELEKAEAKIVGSRIRNNPNEGSNGPNTPSN